VAGRQADMRARCRLQGAVDGRGWRHGGAEWTGGPGRRAGRALMALAHAHFVPFPRATRSRPPPPPQVDAALPAPRWQGGRSNRRNLLSCHSPECLLVCTHVRRPHVSPSYTHRRPGRRRSLLAAQVAALTPRQYTCTRRRWRTFRQSVASIRALRRKQLEDGVHRCFEQSVELETRGGATYTV
jgi:hypothetical protein